jgi:hypothetical protein
MLVCFCRLYVYWSSLELALCWSQICWLDDRLWVCWSFTDLEACWPTKFLVLGREWVCWYLVELGPCWLKTFPIWWQTVSVLILCETRVLLTDKINDLFTVRKCRCYTLSRLSHTDRRNCQSIDRMWVLWSYLLDSSPDQKIHGLLQAVSMSVLRGARAILTIQIAALMAVCEFVYPPLSSAPVNYRNRAYVYSLWAYWSFVKIEACWPKILPIYC